MLAAAVLSAVASFGSALALPAAADCLDELLPRPRIVHRGSDMINATHIAHEGGYTLLVRSGRPKFEGDEEGRRYAREEAKPLLGELIDELCSLASPADMPIVHLGTDEARDRPREVPGLTYSSRLAEGGRQ